MFRCSRKCFFKHALNFEFYFKTIFFLYPHIIYLLFFVYSSNKMNVANALPCNEDKSEQDSFLFWRSLDGNYFSWCYILIRYRFNFE